jgi:hypothetical protein
MRHGGRAPLPPTRRGEPAHSPPRAGCPSASQANVPNCAPLCYCQPPFFVILGPPLFVFLSTPLCHSEPLRPCHSEPPLPCHSEPKARNPSRGHAEIPRFARDDRQCTVRAPAAGATRSNRRLPSGSPSRHCSRPALLRAVLCCHSEPSFFVIPSRASLSFRAEGEESQPRHAEIPRIARDDRQCTVRAPAPVATRSNRRLPSGSPSRHCSRPALLRAVLPCHSEPRFFVIPSRRRGIPASARRDPSLRSG